MVITGLVRSTCDLWDFLLWRILMKNINPLSPESGLSYGPEFFLHQMAFRKFEITFLGKSSQFFAENSCQLYIWAIYDMENVTKLCFNPI